MAEIGQDIEKAARFLREGLCVAIPTETVYGLAANALDVRAVSRIYEIKIRPATNPLIIHVSGSNELVKYAEEVPDLAKALMEQFWPGPLTILLKKRATIPGITTAGLPHAAFRMPEHPLTLALLNEVKFPLAAPSANLSGYISPTKAEHVAKQIGEKIPYILDGGPSIKGIESTVIGLKGSTITIYREGTITADDLILFTDEVQYKTADDDAPASPGMMASHYAPRTKLILVDDLSAAISGNEGKRIGVLSYNGNHTQYPVTRHLPLSSDGLIEAAHNLYAAMHELDEMGLDLIIAELMPDVGVGRAINDRLRRAARY